MLESFRASRSQGLSKNERAELIANITDPAQEGTSASDDVQPRSEVLQPGRTQHLTLPADECLPEAYGAARIHVWMEQGRHKFALGRLTSRERNVRDARCGGRRERTKTKVRRVKGSYLYIQLPVARERVPRTDAAKFDDFKLLLPWGVPHLKGTQTLSRIDGVIIEQSCPPLDSQVFSIF